MSKIIECYIRNDDFFINLIRFNEISVLHIFSTLKKDKILKFSLEESFINEKIECLEENESLKMLPSFFIKNLIFVTVLLRLD